MKVVAPAGVSASAMEQEDVNTSSGERGAVGVKYVDSG